MRENEVAHTVIGAALEVHKALGPGLLESAYVTCLCRELALRNVNYESEVPIAVEYKGEVIISAYRADLLIEQCLLVEVKAIERVGDIQKAQLLTYLKLSNRKLGLLVNFNSILLKDGVFRVVNRL